MATEDIELLRLRAKAKLKLQETTQPAPEPISEPLPEEPGMLSKAKDFVVGTAKDVTQALPAMGAAVGGALGATASGAATMGIGAVPGGLVGAGLGGTAGTTIRNILNVYAFDEDVSTKEALVSPFVGAVEGVTQEVGGLIAGVAAKGATAAAKMVGSKLGKTVELISKPLAGAVSGAMTGTAVGYTVGGWEGARMGGKAGAVIGAIGGAGGIKKISRVLRDDTALVTPRVAVKTAKLIEKESAAMGKAIGKSYEQLDEILTASAKRSESYPGATATPKYRTAGDISKQIEQGAAEELAAGTISKEEFVAVKRQLNSQFGATPAKEMTAKNLHQKSYLIEKEAKAFSETRGTGLKNKALQRIAKHLRGELDDYIIAADDTALANQIAVQRKAFGELRAARDVIKPTLKIMKKEASIEAAERRLALIMSKGPEAIGKANYETLKRAMRARGFAGAIATYAHLLYNDEKFADSVAQIDEAQGQ